MVVVPFEITIVFITLVNHNYLKLRDMKNGWHCAMYVWRMFAQRFILLVLVLLNMILILHIPLSMEDIHMTFINS